MRLVTLAFALLAGVGFASAFPAPNDSTNVDSAAHGESHKSGDHNNANGSQCKEPLIRREWRTLSIPERKEYLNAVLCLNKKPSRAPKDAAPGARTRYDDFNALHIISANGLLTHTGGVHLVGHFVTWHRYFVYLWEKALREECGYTGAQPYWDWTIDADSDVPIEKWIIYNPDHGFGGNGPFVAAQPVTPSWPLMPGQTGGGCVKDGPFTDVSVNVGPGFSLTYNPHCLRRGLNPTRIQYLKSSRTAPLFRAKTFLEFDIIMQGAQNDTQEQFIRLFHSAGHHIQGGDSTDFISSVSEPLFFLHHGKIDKLYADWQAMNPSKRLFEVGGVSIPFVPTSPPVTLDFPLNMQWEAPTVKIREVMNIRGGLLCYEYR